MTTVKTAIFFFALFLTFLFLSRLMAWMVFKIAPQNCEREFTNRDIFFANLAMFIAVILWTALYSLQ